MQRDRHPTGPATRLSSLAVSARAQRLDRSAPQKPLKRRSTALNTPTHEPRGGVQPAWPAFQHSLQCVAGARLNRGDYVEIGRALSCRHSFSPSSVRRVGHSWNFTATVLRVRRDAVNGAKNRVVASSTGPGAGTRPSHAVCPWIGPGTGGGSLDVLILSLIAQLCRLPICLTKERRRPPVRSS